MQVRKDFLMVMLGLAHSINHSLLLILPPLLLIVSSDLNLSVGTLSQVAAISLFMYGGGAVFGGALSDKLGEKKAITISMCLSGLSTFLIFLLPGVYGIGIGLFFIATWSSVYHPTANSLINKVYKDDVALAMSWHGIGGTLGTMAAPIITIAVGLTLGWKYPYLLFGFMAIVTGLFFLRSKMETGMPASNNAKKKTSYLELLKIKDLRPLFTFALTNGLILKGVEFFFPTILVSKGFTISLAGYVLSGVLVGGTIGQYVGAKIANRQGMRNVIVMACISSLAGLVLFQILPPPLDAVTFVVMYGLGFYAIIPAFNVLVGRASPEENRGTVYGLFFLINFGLGSVATSIGGFIIDRFGIVYVFIMIAIFAAVSLISSLRIPSDKPPSPST
jgi:MFS family permease